MNRFLIASVIAGGTFLTAGAVCENICPAQEWPDTEGCHINAHGGGVIFHEGRYYWYGENRPSRGFTTEVGVSCYSSDNLRDWRNEGVALAVSEVKGHDIERGCIMERPKVVYNAQTGKFVMWFHLELKGKGYEAARAAVAVSDTPCGPFRFVRSSRVNPGIAPVDNPSLSVSSAWDKDLEWWTPEWHKAIDEGMLAARDMESGQMSRDMTIFVDDDGKAYHIYSSEENLTLQIAELTDDYLSHTGRYRRIFPGGHNEAPAVMKHNGEYWMIASGCTGWDPNEARLMHADSMLGEWTQLPNPCVGKDADITFRGQSTYILPLEGKKDAYIAMFDIWNPRNLASSWYVWLPVTFSDEGTPRIEWRREWNPDEFWN